MKVTAEGPRRGYFDLTRGEVVHTPRSKLQSGKRVQLPIRDGLLCRILLGERAAGSKKKAASQHDLLCLSFVEKISPYDTSVVDPLGLYEFGQDVFASSHPFQYTYERLATDPCTFVITSPRHTSPNAFIWKMWDMDDGNPFNPLTGGSTLSILAHIQAVRTPMGATFFKTTVVLMYSVRCSRFVNCLSIWRRAWPQL